MKYGKRILIKTLFLILILSMKKGGGSVKAACFCMNKQRIFFDLDGVLAVWQDVPQEHLTQKGYFSSIPIQENVVAAFRLLEQLPDIELYILSCVRASSSAGGEADILSLWGQKGARAGKDWRNTPIRCVD